MSDRHQRRLTDILHAIERIRSYAPATREAFDADEQAQDAIAHRFMVIGEAVYHLPGDLLQHYPGIPWSDIAGMRHIIVHDYDRVNAGILWSSLHDDLPTLERTIRQMLDELPPDPPA